MHGKEGVIRILLSRGSYSTDEVDACGNTPLLEALRMGHRNIAELLIMEHNASVYTKDKTGRMGIHVAAEAGQGEMVKFLLESHGVDVNLLSETGEL